MTTKILINALDSEECRIAKITDELLEEFQIETAAQKITQGNIYKGVVSKIEEGLQASFIDYGAKRHGFLQKKNIHSDYFLEGENTQKSLGELIKHKQEIIIQITKEPYNKKGALLTSFISIAGRYLVLLYGDKSCGVSKKIEDEKERERLKKIVGSFKIPQGFGVIVRTAGAGCSKTKLNKDLHYITRMWKNLKDNAKSKEAPALLHQDQSIAVRVIRESFSDDVTEILIDNENIFNEVSAFIELISPKHKRIIKLYDGAKPIFSKYKIEEQIESIYDSTVKLKSGGSIVINQTEAFVAIDVNSGKIKNKKSIEETAFESNFEASFEIARQLKLRDLGGLIVIDFIDMNNLKHKIEVEKTLRKYLKQDKAKTKIGRISQFGILEMSRQRIMPSIEFGSFVQCERCQGRGRIPSVVTLGLSCLRKLTTKTLSENISSIICRVPSDVAFYLLNQKREELLKLENRENITISIEADDSIPLGKEILICKNIEEPNSQTEHPSEQFSEQL